MSDRNLAGRIALVTGASRGIGRGIAIGLAEAGADVAVNYTRDEAAAAETVAAIQALGRKAKAYRASVTDEAGCAAMVAAVAADFGAMSILVNNAPAAGCRSPTPAPKRSTSSSPSTPPVRTASAASRCHNCGAMRAATSSSSPASPPM